VASTYPERTEFSQDFDTLIAAVENNSELTADAKDEQVSKLSATMLAEKFDYTVSGRVGAALEPVLSPLGFDRKISSALIGALAAKEVFISQLGIIYGMGDEIDEESLSLRERIQADYTPLQGISILLFILISMPCVATAAATYQETNSWRLVVAQLGGLTLTAYLVCLIVYQIGLLLF
jgi:Fe2+ transport system protein B